MVFKDKQHFLEELNKAIKEGIKTVKDPWFAPKETEAPKSKPTEAPVTMPSTKDQPVPNKQKKPWFGKQDAAPPPPPPPILNPGATAAFAGGLFKEGEEEAKKAEGESHSVFSMEDSHAVSKMSHEDGKKHLHAKVDASSATDANKAKIKSAISGSKSPRHLVGLVANHILAAGGPGVPKQSVIKNEDMEKAGKNIGGAGNVASSLKADAKVKHRAEAKRMEGRLSELEGAASGKPANHEVHATLARQQKEYDAHMDNAP